MCCKHCRNRKMIERASREIERQLDLTKFIYKQRMFVLSILELLKPSQALAI